MFSFSIKQLLRQPGKAILFFLLMAASTMLVVSGTIMTIESNARIQIVEDTYSTVAYVTQLPVSYEDVWVSDPCWGDYITRTQPDYGDHDTILPEDIDFPGAKYVVEPEYRPYYISYQPELQHTSEQRYFKRHIVEFTPLEDSVNGQVVDVQITKVLYSRINPAVQVTNLYQDHNMEVGDVISFCQACGHGNYMFPLKAGERYVVGMSLNPPCPEHGQEYCPYLAPRSQQHDARGSEISDGFFNEDWTAPNGTPLGRVDALRPVTGDDFYDEGQPGYKYVMWANLYENEDHAFATMPVNSLKVLMPWHEKETELADGREITQEEFESGGLVCMVPNSLAKINGIRVGDEIDLSFLCSIYGQISAPGHGHGEIPNDTNILYNAQGELFQPFWEQTYKIVGIYRDDTFEFGLWSDALLIPAKSVQASDENNIAYFEPMSPTVTSFQLPNGTIDEFDEGFREAHPELLDQLLIEYDDQGYSEIMESLKTSRDVSRLLLAAGVLAALAILALLLYFFVAKEKKRTAIERSLGMSKRQCRVSLLAGMMILTVAAAGIGSLCGGLALDKIEEFTTIQGEAQTADELDSQYDFDTHYSLWAAGGQLAEDTEIEVEMPAAVYGVVPVGMCLLVWVLSLALMARSFRIDPIYLLSTKDKG